MDNTNLVNSSNKLVDLSIKNPQINDSSNSSHSPRSVVEKSPELSNNFKDIRESAESSKTQRRVELREPAEITSPTAFKPVQLLIKPDVSSGKSNYKFWQWSPYVKRSKSTFIEQLTENVNNRLAENNEHMNEINIPIGQPNQVEDDDHYQRIDICDLRRNFATNDLEDMEEKIKLSHNLQTSQRTQKLYAPPNTPVGGVCGLINEGIIGGKRTDMAESKVNNTNNTNNTNKPNTPKTALNASSGSGRSTPLAKKIAGEAATLTFLDIPFHQTNSEITRSEKDLLILIMAKAGGAKQYHQKKMGVCKFYNKLLGILSQIFSILAGSTGVGSLITETSSGKVSAVALAVVTIIALIAAIFATLQRGFGFENGASSHKQSCTEYGHIVTKIARFLATPDLERKEIEIFTNNIVLELGIAESNEN